MAGAVALLLAAAAWRTSPDPVVSGKPVSYWLKESEHLNPQRAAEGQRILTSHTSEVVRFLLGKARAERSMLDDLHGMIWNALPFAARSRLPPSRSKDGCLAEISAGLHRLGPAAKPALTKALEDPDEDVRAAAGAAFPYARGDLDAEVDWHTRLLRLADYDLRQASASILGMKGTNGYVAIPALVEAMQHDRIEYIRETAARSIARLSAGISETFVPAIRESFKDANRVVRIWCAISLWERRRDPDALLLLIAEFNTGCGEEVPCGEMLRIFDGAGPAAEAAAPAIERIVKAPECFGETAEWMAKAAREALRAVRATPPPVPDE